MFDAMIFIALSFLLWYVVQLRNMIDKLEKKVKGLEEDIYRSVLAPQEKTQYNESVDPVNDLEFRDYFVRLAKEEKE